MNDRPVVERLPDAGECLSTPKKAPIVPLAHQASQYRAPWTEDERVYIDNLATHLGRGGSENGAGQYARRSPLFLRRKRVRG